MERTRDQLEALAQRLGRKHPGIRFEVEVTAAWGPRIVFEHGDVVIANPARDVLGLSPVSPLYYRLDKETVRTLLDANGIDEPEDGDQVQTAG